jgi:hypothetical protein
MRHLSARSAANVDFNGRNQVTPIIRRSNEFESSTGSWPRSRHA